MLNQEDDLDLLLSLQDRVLETPPGSPSAPQPSSPGYLSDDDSSRRTGPADMSVFRNAVQDCLDYEPVHVHKTVKLKGSKASNEAEVEKFSGLRMRNQLFSAAELRERFSDIRFVRLPTIKNLLVGDTLSGCWATVGVLSEKGTPKTSSTGKTYSIWKVGSLDENTVSLFLFGDAYQRNCKEQAGTVFALFNGAVRKDAMGKGFSLSVYSPSQILKIGTSVDCGVCKGKRKDGMPCTLVINKRKGVYCKFHKSKASDKYSTMRAELKGGNLRTAFREPLKPEGIYMVDPLADRTNFKKSMKPVKLMSVEGLKKALSNAGKVTTNTHSQGIRFLTEVTGKMSSKDTNRESKLPKPLNVSEKRKSTVKAESSAMRNQQLDAKRKKTEHGQGVLDKSNQITGKLIELDYVSSDEEL
nr:protein mcm10 like [Quercus suber]